MIENVVLAGSVEEAASKLGEDAVFLGGGTEINRLGSSVSAATLVALKTPPARPRREGDNVVLPLGTTFQAVARSTIVPPCLKEAALFMGSLPKRNMATIAGNLYLHRDDSYMTPCLLAMGAWVELDDGSDYTVKEYLARFEELKRRIITSITVPLDTVVFQKRVAATVESHAVVTAAANRAVGFAAVKGTGLVTVNLAGAKTQEDVRQAVTDAQIYFKDDVHGGAEYKRYLLATVLFDLLKEAR